jgi:hypothetical protein
VAVRTGLLWVALLLSASAAAAAEPERGFVDLYGGGVRLFESDEPGSNFADSSPTAGLRLGVWLTPTWGLTLRTWYYQSDAKIRDVEPSDLAFLGLALEAIARWPVGERWAFYASLGPMLAVNTLDLERNDRVEDARSVAPGVSAGLGVEAQVLAHLRFFTEVQGSLVYPSFHFTDQRLTPRLLNLYGLIGLRVPF